MKVQKQQVYSENLLNNLLNQTDLKRKIKEKIKKTEKKLHKLLSNEQLLNTHINVLETLLIAEIIGVEKKQEKRLHTLPSEQQLHDKKYTGISTSQEMEALTAEEVAGEMMECIDMSVNSGTIDQVLREGNHEIISANEQVLNKENIDPKEKPTVLYKLKIRDLIKKRIDHIYNSNVVNV
ncbi:hypothetical protein [Candidatus Mesenet endosymbiont of Agriotes lineatus]|uniref:hypothetical protein n=1 Tax=Candidatus Mesenet endosymbiont of Agriotes lineatus TaxID=3077948 RepID=UPI0030D1931C